MKKKLIATVMAATMAVTALTGCGSSSASSAKKGHKGTNRAIWRYSEVMTLRLRLMMERISQLTCGSGEAMNYFRRLLTDTQLFILM